MKPSPAECAARLMLKSVPACLPVPDGAVEAQWVR